MTRLLLLSGETVDPTPGGANFFQQIAPLIMLGVLAYLLFVVPERKKTKEAAQIVDNLQVADEVVSAGGIIGRVVSVKDNTVLIETGGDRNRIRLLRTAIVENRTHAERLSKAKRDEIEARKNGTYAKKGKTKLNKD